MPKFDLFSDEVSSMKASDMMKISSMITNRKKQQLALNSSDESLGDLQESFQINEYKQPPRPPTTMEPIIPQSSGVSH